MPVRVTKMKKRYTSQCIFAIIVYGTKFWTRYSGHTKRKLYGVFCRGIFFSGMIKCQCLRSSAGYNTRYEKKHFHKYKRFLVFIRIVKGSLYLWTNTSLRIGRKRKRKKAKHIDKIDRPQPHKKNGKQSKQSEIFAKIKSGLKRWKQTHKWGKHRKFFENEHASGALRAPPTTTHTNGQAYLVFLNKYLTDEKNTINRRNLGKMSRIGKKKKTKKKVKNKWKNRLIKTEKNGK